MIGIGARILTLCAYPTGVEDLGWPAIVAICNGFEGNRMLAGAPIAMDAVAQYGVTSLPF